MITDLMNMDLDILRSAPFKTKTGETKPVWTVVDSVPGSIQQAFAGRRSDLLTDAGRMVGAWWQTFLPPGTDVKPGDRVSDGTRVFEVVLLEDMRGHHLEARLREVNVATSVTFRGVRHAWDVFQPA